MVAISLHGRPTRRLLTVRRPLTVQMLSGPLIIQHALLMVDVRHLGVTANLTQVSILSGLALGGTV